MLKNWLNKPQTYLCFVFFLSLTALTTTATVIIHKVPHQMNIWKLLEPIKFSKVASCFCTPDSNCWQLLHDINCQPTSVANEKMPCQADALNPTIALELPPQPNSTHPAHVRAFKNSFALCLRVGDYSWKLAKGHIWMATKFFHIFVSSWHLNYSVITADGWTRRSFSLFLYINYSMQDFLK